MKLEYIQWKDHWGPTENHWGKFDNDFVPKPLLVNSVGWVKYETKEMVCLLPHWYNSVEDDAGAISGQGEIYILKSVITKRKTLKV